MRPLDQCQSIDEAWVAVLQAAHHEAHGRLLHVVVAIDAPGPPMPELVALNDELLQQSGHHCVDRVASTVFPSSSYADPGLTFDPDMPAESLAILDSAEQDLYSRYRTMLPQLQTFDGNSHGTYFGRLVSWPGKDGDGYNQLEVRVRQLRGRRRRKWSSTNAADMTTDDPVWSGGLREYDAQDERPFGFPCLVHIDISVVNNRLSLLAVYRNWYLIEKAYGNLIGLTRLHHFLAQQTGYELGELMVHATVADAQQHAITKVAVAALLDRANEQLAARPGRETAANGVAVTRELSSSSHGRIPAGTSR
ncbi:MAG: hypothetical protein DI630_30485 [Gordonia sp. (in: high G+C Gram-positive bacteria)]|nr:MAG: hypothetical protein DI630_30485 [Gordonia sp. (in: high G+C Gram-positive bacteria)]